MTRTIGRIFLRVTGWRIEGAAPHEPRFVMIAAPHTSNWDLVYMLSVAWALGIHVSWMGKEVIFRWPFGRLVRRFGGIPVRRDRAHNLVAQMVSNFAAADRLVLAVPPEGTRGVAPHWKSGFYHIALGAGVPVVTGFLDYSRKVGGVGPTVTLTGDVPADMDRFREFYGPIVGRHPAKQGLIRLRPLEQVPPTG